MPFLVIVVAVRSGTRAMILGERRHHKSLFRIEEKSFARRAAAARENLSVSPPQAARNIKLTDSRNAASSTHKRAICSIVMLDRSPAACMTRA
ncbi:hypothetical protein [Paraburkholderia acidisoli]|uniref:Uncharacterized protein n=1 Tax=Paraburkholderia acidisoli TaxID=2571748 RepID=A0A7Z2GQX7_9BURK|nr:hypothetical protein [Paraburkholderia acidisoli]QGZ66059.1 hypothetical protein FAZ98_30040 [Paraburkholderia acidisoli]